MANKYLRHGETYCGDGTTSAAAAGNGGVGAWNNINVFTGTAPAYGALSAGDDVYIRSKDAAGSNITVSNSATINIGSTSATAISPINWVIDAGTVWSGIAGVVQYTMTGAPSGVAVRNYNNLIASNYNLVFLSSVAGYSNAVFFNSNLSSTKEIKIDCSANTTPFYAGPYHEFKGGTHVSPWIRNGSVTYHVITSTGLTDTTLIAPIIEVLGPLYFAATAISIFNMDGYSSNFKVYGGELKTTFSDLNLVKLGQYCGTLGFYGFKYPSTMAISTSTLFDKATSVSTDGGDGAVGSCYFDYFFTYSSRHDGNYPTLNATLELSGATPWSYSIYPYRTNQQNPATVSVSKVWTQAAAAKTITVELLWPQAMATPKSDKVYAVMCYTDSTTGEKVRVSSQAFPASTLAASTPTPDWSAVTYGPTTFDRYKIAITTPSSIKQDTEVMITFVSSPKSASAQDIIILCPDPVFS